MSLIKQKIEKWVVETLGEGTKFNLVHPKEIENGDFSLIVDVATAERDFATLRQAQGDFISEIKFVAPRFINIYLSEKFFTDSILEINEKKEEYGKTNLLKDQKVFIEHTQPNPFKKFHIGHLMNNAIGESISRILKANGAEIKACTYHGDKGMHVAMTVYSLYEGYIADKSKFETDLFNLPVDIEDLKRKLYEIGHAYFIGTQMYQNGGFQKDQIVRVNKIIYTDIDDTESKIITKLYKWGRELSFSYFDLIYKKLDSNFDYHFFESESGELGKKIVEENIGKVFQKGENGAVIFEGEKFEPKTHTRVFLNSEGLPTYEAKELGLAKIKKDIFEYDRSITVTANEQDAFFKVVEVAIGQIFPEIKNKLQHLSHGILKLPTGKMSSRTGDVITAESLIEKIKEKVLEKIADRDFGDEERREVAEIVAIGAIKYSILRQAIGGDIIFDFDKSISFEGDSGPYIQYAYIRAKSVLEKSEIRSTKSEIKTERPEGFGVTELERILYKFPEVVEKSGSGYAPHHLVTYLTELASNFNSFYANEQILDDSDSTNYKLLITLAVSIVLKNGLALLGIRTPQRM